MRNTRRRVGTTLLASGLLAFSTTSFAAPGDPIHETCPESGDVGENVECYPVTFISKTEVHPDGIPIIGYLFVPENRPDEPLPAIVFAHGSGSMYSSGNHNKGLNSKHKQWVKQYTSELGIVSLHVSSFHSRYLLPDTDGDQRVLEIDVPPDGTPGGDDYRATSYLGYGEDEDDNPLPYQYLQFDPDPADEEDKWKDSDNGGAGVSEIIERSYDMDAAWDFLAGIRVGTALDNARNEDDDEPTLGTPFAGTGYIGDIVSGGLRIDHERIFLYGTSHGGQTTMAAAHAPRALADNSPMNIDLPDGFERRRFAAFFDYYGGCGLYGAYNGADFDPDDPDDNSTWRPYGPFLMLHGEFDGIWKEQETGTVREQWLNSECKPRIDAAKADPDFDEFLEVVIYEDAEHSFDGVERDDFDSALDEEYDSWLAKIHANYRITVPFMEAIGRQVAAARNSETVPPLDHLGFPERLPDFDTFPLPSSLGPQPVTGGALDIGAGVTIDDLTNGQLDIETLLIDPFRFFDLFCEIDGAPVNVSANECVVDFSLTEDQLDSDIPTWFWIYATTARGRTALPVRLALSGTQSGELTFGEPFYAISVWPVSSEHDDTIDLPVDGLVWSRFTSGNELHAELSVDAAGYSIENSRVLNGPVPEATPQTVNLRHYTSGNAVASQAMAFDAGDGTVGIQLIQFEADGLDDAEFDTPALPFADFSTNFVALTPVDDGPGGDDPGGDGPGGDGPGGDDPGGDDPGGDDPGGDDPGGGDPGGDDPGGSDPGGDDPGNDDPDDSDSGGGGAFLWLLPTALLLRRRNRALPA